MTERYKDLNARDREIIQRLDVLAAAIALGLRPAASASPNEKGWLSCHAIDREDNNPSASLNVQNGLYIDRAQDSKVISFFKFAVRAGKFTRWQDARDHYGVAVGLIDPNAGNRKRRRASGEFESEAAVIEAAARSAAKERKCKPSDLQLTTHVYRQVDGSEVFRVLKFRAPDGKKACRPVHYASGAWKLKQSPTRVIYRLPELTAWLAATPQQPVLVLEGEKDVDAALQLGYVATTNIGGAGKWRAEDSEALRGRHVVIICDNDEAGRAHGSKAAASLLPVAASVRLVEKLPGVPEKGDLSDYIDAGGDYLQLKELILSYPRLTAPSPPSADEPKGIVQSISNYEIEFHGEEKESYKPRKIIPIVNDIFELLNEWPGKVGDLLFAPKLDGSVRYLRTEHDLMSHIGFYSSDPPDIKPGAGFHTKKEIFSQVLAMAKEFQAIETLPHEPPIDGHYYACDLKASGDGRRLNELLDRFCFSTPVDRVLFQALLMTPFWGGPGGSRPAFLITSDSGRGAGKTTAVKIVAEISGGMFEYRPGGDFNVFVTQLLSPQSRGKRLVLHDNLKSERYSSAEFEGLITARDISGRELYVGNGSRPNTLTYCLTSNGASLSVDLAQRVMVIKLAKPPYDSRWEQDTLAFIRRHRSEIIADLLAALRSEATILESYTRWASWELEVLGRVSGAAAVHAVICERRAEVNVDEEESTFIIEHFADRIASGINGFPFNPDTERIFLPSSLVTELYNQATGEKLNKQRVSRKLNQLAEESPDFPLKKSRTNGSARGFIWTGKHATNDATIRRDLVPRGSRHDELFLPADDTSPPEDGPGTIKGRFSA